MKKKYLVVIGYGGMGKWHIRHAQKSDVVNLIGTYDILEEKCIAATEAALTAQSETAPTDVKIDDNRPIADDLTSQEGTSDTAEGDNNED